MSLSKLKRLHVIIIGVVACVLCAVGLFFLLIKPLNEQIATTTSQLTEAQGIAAQLPESKQQLVAAQSQVRLVQIQLDRYQASKMPNLSFVERDKGMLQLWHEQSEVLGPVLERWASRGVRLESGIGVPAPPSNPNDLQPGMIKIPLGKVDIDGNFRALLDNLRGWNNCPRLVQIDRPSLSGTSPFLKATYEMTVYIFPRTEPGPSIKMAGGGGAAPGAAPGGPAPAPAPPPAVSSTPPPSGGSRGLGGGGGAGEEGT
jgi:hypothetical protein